MIFKILVNNDKYGMLNYLNLCRTVDEAREWLQSIINSKSTPQTDWITLQIGDARPDHSGFDYRAIITVNNPIAYRR